MALAPGTKLGPYEILAPLGAGGMGEVYKDTDSRIGRAVAVKVSREPFSDRFEREARAIASLNHPSICILHEVGPDDLVMEYIEGPTLAGRIATGAIPAPEALPIASQLEAALEAAHQKGIVHRDLKPANVKLAGEGAVKVLDFGLARSGAAPTAASGSSTVVVPRTPTGAGVILGTPGSPSPEQAREADTDKRADIRAFGVVLFEMLTGRSAFVHETVSDSLAAVLTADPAWELLPTETPAPIRRLLRRCLQRDRRLRLHDIADPRLEIDDALGTPKPAAAPRRRSAWPWLSWRPSCSSPDVKTSSRCTARTRTRRS